MKVKIVLFAPFRDLFGINEKVLQAAEGTTAQVILADLCDSQECWDKMFDESKDLRPEIAILKNGTHIRSLNGLKTMIKSGDEIAAFPTVAANNKLISADSDVNQAILGTIDALPFYIL